MTRWSLLLQTPSSSYTTSWDSTGATENIFEEYLWLMKVNAPGTDVESRTVEIYRLIEANCDATAGGAAVACTAGGANVTDRSKVDSLVYLQIN